MQYLIFGMLSTVIDICFGIIVGKKKWSKYYFNNFNNKNKHLKKKIDVLA